MGQYVTSVMCVYLVCILQHFGVNNTILMLLQCKDIVDKL